MKWITWCWLGVFLWTPAPAAAEKPSPVPARISICHIANAGFYLSYGETGILIDGILGKPYQHYQHPTAATNQAIEASTGRFEDVRLVLITHLHGDHFDAEATLRHMEHNAKAHYVMPPQALSRLKEAGLNEAQGKRIDAPSLEVGEWRSFPDLPGVEVVRLRHANDNRIENFAYLVRVGDQCILHPGDVGLEASALEVLAKKDALKVDLLFLPFWFLLEPEPRDRVRRTFDWTTLIPMHLLDDERGRAQEWTQEYGGWEAVIKTLLQAFPDTIELRGEMACVGAD